MNFNILWIIVLSTKFVDFLKVTINLDTPLEKLHIIKDLFLNMILSNTVKGTYLNFTKKYNAIIANTHILTIIIWRMLIFLPIYKFL
tara:strand:- start:134 stop:394 length:261 start_codon:yes stop_codon:yes gene_type:complete